jgi:glutaminyl-tRNA synthetase
VRLYDRLFNDPDPAGKKDGTKYTDHINPDSLKIVTGKLEPSLASAKPGDKFQFERVGYFCVDTKNSDLKLVFNRTVTLRDTWAKVAGKTR